MVLNLAAEQENETILERKRKMKTVVLKNGATEATALVATVMVALSSLMERKPMAVYELNELCKDRNHKIFGDLGTDLTELALLEGDGQPHGSIKNIVLSAISGEGLEMALGHPVRT